MPIIISKSIEFNEKSNKNLATSDSNKNNIFFKIYYNNDRKLYYLLDMGVGYGTFYKIEEETVIKENSIINIGESYLVFSFNKKDYEDNREVNEEDLFLKIYSNEGEYSPILIQNEDRVFEIGRSEKCDIYIQDKMLSRIHCILFYTDNNWYIKDGNENGNLSTNGTWVYANEKTEIKEGMKFKSNSCNFLCKFQ